MKLEDFLQKNYNYNPDVKDAIRSYINMWRSWYVGNVKSFHNYYIYNGQRKVNKKRTVSSALSHVHHKFIVEWEH